MSLTVSEREQAKKRVEAFVSRFNFKTILLMMVLLFPLCEVAYLYLKSS